MPAEEAPTAVIEPPVDNKRLAEQQAAQNVDVNLAFDPAARQAQDEFNTYLENRPYKDEQGQVHDPASGEVVEAREYHDDQRDIEEQGSQKAYEDMGVMELARELAKAELSGDRTTMRNVEDVLIDKIAEQAGDMQSAELNNEVKGGKHSPAVTRPDATPMEADPETALIDRVYGYKDHYKDKISHVDGGPSQEQVSIQQSRNRIDVDQAQLKNNILKQMGVPDEIIKDIPKEFFYNPDDPDYKDIGSLKDMPDDLRDWLQGNGAGVVDPGDQDPTQATERTADVAAREFFDRTEGQDLCQEMAEALNEYSILLAKHETHHTRLGSKKLDEARVKYEKLRQGVLFSLAEHLEAEGFDRDAIDAEIEDQQYNTEGSDNGNETVGGDVGLVEQATRAEAERFARESKFAGKLASLWAKKGWRGVLGKAGIMIPVGVVAGAAGGVVFGPAIGAAAATIFATRIAKGFMGGKLSARANAVTNARAHAAERREQQIRVIEAADRQLGHAGRPIDSQRRALPVVRDVTSSFSRGAERNIARNQRRAGVMVGAGLAAGAAGAIIADHIDINPFDKAPNAGGGGHETPPTGGSAGEHFERTHHGELFKLSGDEHDPSRLQLVHEQPGVGSSDSVTLQSADGSVTLEDLKIGPNGLTEESILKVHNAGYDVRYTPDADGGAGRLEIFRQLAQQQLEDQEDSTS